MVKMTREELLTFIQNRASGLNQSNDFSYERFYKEMCQLVRHQKERFYIKYLNASNNFKETEVDFNSYDEAKKWLFENIEKPDIDMIKTNF